MSIAKKVLFSVLMFVFSFIMACILNVLAAGEEGAVRLPTALTVFLYLPCLILIWANNKFSFLKKTLFWIICLVVGIVLWSFQPYILWLFLVLEVGLYSMSVILIIVNTILMMMPSSVLYYYIRKNRD